MQMELANKLEKYDGLIEDSELWMLVKAFLSVKWRSDSELNFIEISPDFRNDLYAWLKALSDDDYNLFFEGLLNDRAEFSSQFGKNMLDLDTFEMMLKKYNSEGIKTKSLVLTVPKNDLSDLLLIQLKSYVVEYFEAFGFTDYAEEIESSGTYDDLECFIEKICRHCQIQLI